MSVVGAVGVSCGGSRMRRATGWAATLVAVWILTPTSPAQVSRLITREKLTLWVQPMNASTGDGPVISVNSWGYVGSPGMAGPKLYGSSAACVFSTAESTAWSSVPSADGEAGVAVDFMRPVSGVAIV